MKLSRVLLSIVSCLVLTNSLFAQNFQVGHLAGSPGGPGTADGVGAAARFMGPSGVTGDGTYIYVADQHRIRRVTPQTGEVTTIAGDVSVTNVVDGIGLQAGFAQIKSISLAAGVLYIADSGYIRQMVLATGAVQTLLQPQPGSGTLNSIWSDGQTVFFSDPESIPPPHGGPPIPGRVWLYNLTTGQAAQLAIPTPANLINMGIITGSPACITGYGRDLYIAYTFGPDVALGGFIVSYSLDSGASRLIVESNLNSGSTTGGSFAFPHSMWAGNDGFLYLTDATLAVYRIDVSDGEIEPIFGKAGYRAWIDGPAADARFRAPGGIWGDGVNLFVGDEYVLRIANLATQTVSTLAGTGVRTVAADDTPNRPPSLKFGLWSDVSNLYFSTGDSIQKMPLSGGAPVLVARFAGIYSITGIWSDGTDMYAVDNVLAVIDKVNLATGNVSVFAGEVDAWTLRDGIGTAAGFDEPFGIWGDGTYLYVSEPGYIRKIVIATAEVTTIAGSPGAGLVDGVGSQARFLATTGLWGDGTYLYIADEGNRAIRRMSLDTYNVVTIAGGNPSGIWADGIGPAAQFDLPQGLWGDGTHLYVADDSATIRSIDLATSAVTTIAGNPRHSGTDDGIGSVATFAMPSGILGVGGLLYITDQGRLRTLNLQTDEVKTLIGRVSLQVDGTGMSAAIDAPKGMWVDGTTLYFTDYSSLRKLDLGTQQVTTLAGWPGETGVRDGIGSYARFYNPSGICGDSAYLYIADAGNNMIRRVTKGSWTVSLVSGTGVIGKADGIGGVAQFYNPVGLWCTPDYLYVADGNNQRLRRIALATGEVTTLLTNLGIGLGTLWGDDKYLFIPNGLADTILQYEFSSGQVTTLAGPFSDQTASVTHIWGDASYLYVPSGSAIRRIHRDTGESEIIAGIEQIYGSEDGFGASGRFWAPGALSGDGINLYVSDMQNHAIRTVRIAPPGLTSLAFDPSSGSALSRTTAGFPDSVTVGYGRIQSNGSGLGTAGMAIYADHQNGVLISETAVPSTPAISAGRIYVDNSFGVRTGLAIVNPNTAAVTLSFYYTDANGMNAGSGTTVLAPNQHVAAFLDEAPFAATGMATATTFTFTASQNVAAIALRGFTNERSEFLMTTLPVVDLSQSTSSALVIPHFAAGGGWTTEIALVNPSDSALDGTFDFYDPTGVRTASQQYHIASRSSRTIQLAATNSAIQVGSIRVTPTASQNTPVGLSIFSFNVQGVTVTQSGVPTLAPSNDFQLYIERSGPLQSALALANAGPQPATIDIQLSGFASLGTITLPAFGQRALFLNEIPGLESMPMSYTGIARITTNSGTVSAVGLRTRYNERGDFLIATTTPLNDNAPVPAETFFPHFVDGGGYTTEFILYNSSGQLFFFSESGQAQPLVVENE